MFYLDWLFNKFDKYRQSLGLSFFFVGLPIVYFFRDGLKIAQGSSAFTAAATLSSLLLAFPLNIKRVFQANTIAYLMCFLYAAMAFIYLLTYVPNAGWFTNIPIEMVNLFYLILALFIFSGISINTLQPYFLRFVVLFSVLGAVSLLYYIMRNPAYVLGMRAAISFGDEEGMSSMGNPHIYAKSAYMGLVTALVLLRSEKDFVHKLILYASIVILIVVIGLCQSMAILIVTGIFMFLFFISNFNAHKIYRILKWIFGWQGLMMFFGIFYLIISYYKSFESYIDHLSIIVFGRLEKIFTSFFSSSTEKAANLVSDVDPSASTRVETITKVFEIFNQHLEDGNIIKLLFGNGYQQYYVDSPFFEMLNDLGIIGFLVFLILHLVIIRWVIKEIFYPTCNFTQVLAFFFLVTLIQNFTFGMPYDYGRWCSMAFIARFAVDYKKQYGVKEN